MQAGSSHCVETSDSDRPTRRYALWATIYPEWEVTAVGGPLPTVLPGRPGRQNIRIASRSTLAEGGSAAGEVVPSTPLTATFLAATAERLLDGDIVSSTRDVEVGFPGSVEPGIYRGQITFRWTDGRVRGYEFHWRVAPALRASPARLVLKPSDGDIAHTIVIRSEGRDFRVLAVDPEGMVTRSEFADDPATVQTIKLRV